VGLRSRCDCARQPVRIVGQDAEIGRRSAEARAGLITSLTETDGLVELAEDATAVVPGAPVGFLSYAALVG